MGFDAKYGRVTTEHGDIPDDEPVLILRGRDLAVPRTIAYYRRVCKMMGSPEAHLQIARDAEHYIEGWQRYHQDRTKVPTSAAYLDRTGSQQ